MDTEKKDFYSIKEFADRIGVHPNSVRNMIKSGRLNAFRIGGGKTSSYRISETELHRLPILNLQDVVNTLVENKIRERFSENQI